MKNKLLYSLIAGAVVMTGLSSCDNEEFLNVTHYSILEMSTMYESDANAKAALNGCYDRCCRATPPGTTETPSSPICSPVHTRQWTLGLRYGTKRS